MFYWVVRAVMSSQDSIGTVLKCMQNGAVDFLVKPVRKNELRNLWQHVWRRHSVSPHLSFSFAACVMANDRIKKIIHILLENIVECIKVPCMMCINLGAQDYECHIVDLVVQAFSK